jgi:hypothetical protein
MALLKYASNATLSTDISVQVETEVNEIQYLKNED